MKMETETGERHTFFPLATHSLWVGESHKLCEKPISKPILRKKITVQMAYDKVSD